jgi:ribosomal protein S18 acetylase RimI-like enzyme
MQRVSASVIGEPDATESEVRDDLMGPRFDIATDTALVVNEAGQALVYAQAYDEHDDRVYIDVFVTPELDDDVFAHVADQAVSGATARLREMVRARGGTGPIVAAGVYQGEQRMLEAYTRAGLVRTRVYWRMTVELPADQPVEVGMPPGVTIRAVDPDDDDVMAQALQLRNDTFREHHGFTEPSFDEFAERWRDSSSYDRGAWWFAYLDDAVVGLCLGDESKLDDNTGYVGVLGVGKSARGLGIARALLLTAFAEYQRRGRSSVELGVDSANETGATRLYESVGMTTKFAIDALEMPLEI